MATQLLEPLSGCVWSAADDTSLSAINRGAVALSLWRRPLPPGLGEALEALVLDDVDDLEWTIDGAIGRETLAPELAAAGYGDRAAGLLASDLAELATQFAEITGCPRLTIRLEVVATDGCWLFHADYVIHRLLTTYRGEGTQWVHADRPDAVEQMRTGEVAIFKGRLLIDEPPILHRSPPIALVGERRLLLRIDPETGE